ncbi:ADP-ribosyltransferase [Soonwooa purpurea]
MRTTLHSEIRNERCNQAALGLYNASVAAIQTYQGNAFDGINNELRYDEPDIYKNLIKDIDRIKDVTNDTLYRGLDHNFTMTLKQLFKIKDINDLSELKLKLEGKVLKDKGFSSTSKDLNTAAYFARDTGKGKTTVMQISGVKEGVDVQRRLGKRSKKNEKEFLIKRDSSYLIEKVSISKTGKLILYTKYI